MTTFFACIGFTTCLVAVVALLSIAGGKCIDFAIWLKNHQESIDWLESECTRLKNMIRNLEHRLNEKARKRK